MLLDLAEQLDSLRTVSPGPKVCDPESGDKHGTEDETPKKIKPGDTGTLQRNITSPVRRRVN